MIFVITGPSGCGKSTLINRVMAGLPGLAFSVSHTTRGPRPSETDGINYHFVSEEAFRKMEAEYSLTAVSRGLTTIYSR